MPQAQSDDIEIYIKKIKPEKIVEWLEDHFEAVDVKRNNKGIFTGTVNRRINLESVQIPLYVLPKAAGAAYTSLWFKSKQTPWKNDLECAEAFLEAFDTEVRCNSPCLVEDKVYSKESIWHSITRKGGSLFPW